MPLLLAALGLMLTEQARAQTFTTLHNFALSDGALPTAGLILSGNTLYGTATFGGTYNSGTVFVLNTDGTGFSVLHNFKAAFVPNPNSGGAHPHSGLVLLGGTLYGTADWSSFGAGTIFALQTDGTGFTNLYDFTARPDYTNSDGAFPYAGLFLSGNTLYGAAEFGGSSGNGTVFAVNTDGTGFSVLHSFTVTFSPHYTNCDGAGPRAGVILSGNTLYGTTQGGGSSGKGTVFAVNTDGTGFATLHSFTTTPHSTNSEGAAPDSPLILSGRTLYGTTVSGGTAGNGTVFTLNTDGTSFSTLHSFTESFGSARVNSDGVSPLGPLVLSGNVLYGTAQAGGSSGQGTVFSLQTNGTGFTNVHNFRSNSGGANPNGLIRRGTALYGTTFLGGSSGQGTVFSLSLGSTPPTVSCSGPLILECKNGSAVGTIKVEAQDAKGNPIQIIWTMDGIPSQANTIPSEGDITASNVTFTANFGLGEHVVVVSASNGQSDPVTCSTTVTVHDTTSPQIVNIVATPNVLWPPNHCMVPVTLMLSAVDNCDPAPVVRIINVTSNEPQNPFGSDWEITEATSVNLRSERLGKGPGRIYTILVQCMDASGNSSTASVNVTVPHN